MNFQLRAETNLTARTSPLTLSLALFWFLLAVYLLTYSPRFHSSDGLAMFATAESLARRGEWDADQIRWMGLQQGTFGLDGHLYTRKGVGVSLLALPLVWLGLIVPGWGPATTALIFNALVTAAAGALLLRYLQRLGYDDRVALVAGLIFGLATLAWPYAKTFFSDPLAGLCLVVAALAMLHFSDTGRAADALWAGLALAVSVATRYANAVMIPLFGLLLLKSQIGKHLHCAQAQVSANQQISKSANQRSAISNSQSPISNPQSLISSLRAWFAFGVPLVVTAIAIAFFNVARYGDPLNTGYLPEESFGGIWWQGIAGLLISPGRGLFLYAPVLLMALPAAPTFFRRHGVQAALVWAIILAHLLLYSKWFMWHGGYAWGPRFMAPTLPFFVMGLAPAIEKGRESAWWRWGLIVLAVLSGLIQVLGLSIHFELFQNRLLDTGLPLYAPITFFDPHYSPLIGQFQFLRPEDLDFAWMVKGRVDGALLIPLVVAVLVSGWGLVQVGNKGRGTGERVTSEEVMGEQVTSSEGRKSLDLVTRYPLPLTHYLLLIAPVLLATAAWLLVRAHAFPYGDLRDAVAVLNAHTTAADAILTGTPDEAVAFADLYKGRADVLGLNAGPSPDADTAATLARMVKSHPHVWWLPNWLPPEKSGIERWLMEEGFRAENRSIGERRLALYYFPSQSLTGTAIGATFGGAIALERASTLPATHPGDVLPVVLHWRATQRVTADYHVFVHLLDAEGNRVAQSDGQPALWTRPTSSWSPGEGIEDQHGLSLPTDLPSGDYTLIVGLYNPTDGTRLRTEEGVDHVSLATIKMH
jgi:hypothetical protein